MTKIVVSSFLLLLFPLVSQNVSHLNGGHFVKKIEYNLNSYFFNSAENRMIYNYNLTGKNDVENLFFEDYNAKFEFLFSPCFEMSVKGDAGFRIAIDTLNSFHKIEIKSIPNYEEVFRMDTEKQNLIEIPTELIGSLPRNIVNLIHDYNKGGLRRTLDERPKHFKVKTLCIPISDEFASILYNKAVSFIDNFMVKGVPLIITGGYSVIFRVVVEDEVWSLWIHEPQGNSKKMSDLCRQIITDAQNSQFDESKYMSILNTFEFENK